MTESQTEDGMRRVLIEIFRISTGSAYEGCRRGEIPSLRLGRRIIVPVHQFVRS